MTHPDPIRTEDRFTSAIPMVILRDELKRYILSPGNIFDDTNIEDKSGSLPG